MIPQCLRFLWCVFTLAAIGTRMHAQSEPARPALALPKAAAAGAAEGITTHGDPAPEPSAPVIQAPSAAHAEKPADTNSSHTGEAQSLLRLGNDLSDRGEFSAAEIAYRQVMSDRAYPPSEQRTAMLGLARMFRKQNSFTRAVAIYEKFLKEYPDDERTPEALLEVGRSYRALGAFKLAISRFYAVINSTLKLSGAGFEHYQLLARTAQFEIAETHYASGDFVEAGKFFSRLRLLDLAPQDRARAHFKSACAQQLAGDTDTAIATLRSYLEQWPTDANVPEARYLLATTLRQQGRTQEALATTLELLRTEKSKTETSDPKIWLYWQRRTGNQLANDFFQAGDTINALAVYHGLSELSPDPVWRLPVTYQIALCYERMHMSDRARTAFQNVIDGAKSAPASDGKPGLPSELQDLARMASWRLDHLEWRDDNQAKVTSLFVTNTGHMNTPAAPTPAAPTISVPQDVTAPASTTSSSPSNDSHGNAAESPTTLR